MAAYLVLPKVSKLPAAELAVELLLTAELLAGTLLFGEELELATDETTAIAEEASELFDDKTLLATLDAGLDELLATALDTDDGARLELDFIALLD